MEESTTTPRASGAMLYTVIAAVGGIALGLAIGLLAGGSGTVTADPSAVVVETGGEESVITPEAAEAAGYVPAPSYRVVPREDAAKIEDGMTAPEVEALFPAFPMIYSTPSVQPLTNPYRTSQVARIGLSADGYISLIFTDGRLTSHGWLQGPDRGFAGARGGGQIIQAVLEGKGGEWDSQYFSPEE